MSSEVDFTEIITLIDKTNPTITTITIDEENTGNLQPYRIRAKFTPTAIRKQKHGEILLRTDDGLFIKNGPILIDEDAKDKYQIQARIDQPDGAGGTRNGELMRFDISKPTIETGDKGQYLMIPLIAPDSLGGKEVPDSERIRFKTPREAFLQRVINYTAGAGSSGPLISIANVVNDILLPDTDALRQNYLPVRPMPFFDHLNEIIDRLAQAPASGGTFTDYYYYTFPDVSATKTYNIIAKEFGSESSGVVIDVLGTEIAGIEEQDTIQIDNVKPKNVVIVRGANGAHSLPMDYARFASDYTHARASATYSNVTTYAKGDYCRSVNHLFKSLQDNNLNNIPNNSGDTTFWENLTLTAKFSPWTNDSTVWPANVFGTASPPSGYVGLVPDMNYVGPDYNRTEDDNEFENITLKDISHTVNDPTDTLQIPANEIYHGQRVLIGTSPVGVFAGHANKIAQYDNKSDPQNPIWHISRSPVNDDTIIDKENATILRWNGSSWIVQWTISTDFATSSPLHPLKSIANVDGATVTQTTGGTPQKSAEYEYDWNNFVSTGGNVINIASRGAWWYLEFPFPRHDVGSHNTGDFYTNPVLDFNNFNLNSKGEKGWNNGLGTEDLSALRSVACKLRLTFKDSSGNLVDGMADMPVIWWFRDLFDRIVYTEVKARRNGRYTTIDFKAGPEADMQLHDNRTDELISILGYTLPTNFFFEEKEYTGVRFDWENVKAMGCFWRGAYDENFFYKGAQDSFIEGISQNLTQIVLNLTRFFGDPAIANVVVDNAKIAIDELRFTKDAYVSSQDSTVTRVRSKQINRPKEFDYINLKNIAKAEQIRSEFHPQMWIVNSIGDNRVRYGQTLVVQGDRIPGSPQTLTCNECTHILDDRGYTMQTVNTRKFVVP